MNYCPKCGFEVRDMHFCPKCGFKVDDFVSDETQLEAVELHEDDFEAVSPEESAFTHERMTQEEPDHVSFTSEKEALREALVRDKTEHYLPIFSDLDKTGGISWNWCAFFVPPLWFAYRKMYGWSIAAILAPVILGSLIGFLLVTVSGGMSDSALNGFAKLLGVGMGVVFASISNKAYKSRIDKLISMMPEDPEMREKYIAQKGGTSALAVIVAMVLYVLEMIALNQL